jgi:hypothetical protein
MRSILLMLCLGVIGVGAWNMWTGRDRNPTFRQLVDRADAEFVTGDRGECIVQGSVNRDEAYQISLRSPCDGLLFEYNGDRLGTWNGNTNNLTWMD